MKRNLSRRIEVAFPIYDKELHQQIQKIINLQLSDNQKARLIDQNQTNEYKTDSEEKIMRSQIETYQLLK
jgi:polyphosphate kinase